MNLITDTCAAWSSASSGPWRCCSSARSWPSRWCWPRRRATAPAASPTPSKTEADPGHVRRPPPSDATEDDRAPPRAGRPRRTRSSRPRCRRPRRRRRRPPTAARPATTRPRRRPTSRAPVASPSRRWHDGRHACRRSRRRRRRPRRSRSTRSRSASAPSPRPSDLETKTVERLTVLPDEEAPGADLPRRRGRRQGRGLRAHRRRRRPGRRHAARRRRRTASTSSCAPARRSSSPSPRRAPRPTPSTSSTW